MPIEYVAQTVYASYCTEMVRRVFRYLKHNTTNHVYVISEHRQKDVRI